MTFIQFSAPAIVNQAIAHQQAGRLTEAEAACQSVLQHCPDHGYARYLLGVITYQQGQVEQAIAHYQQALPRLMSFAELHNHLAIALDDQGEFEAAITHYQTAIDLKPEYAEAWQNLGTAYQHHDQLTEAIECYEKAAALQPTWADIYNNLGSAYRRLGQLPQSLAHYNRAIALNPQHVNAQCGRADVLLRLGNFRQGWVAYEWRWHHPDCPPRPLPYPTWDGTPFWGKTLLIHTEQGLGDAIQFIRYIPLVRQRGDRVIVELHQPGLKRLFESIPGIDHLIQRGDPLPPVDWQAPLLSLPRILGTLLSTIPADVPYLSAPIPLKPLPQGDRSGIKLGVVWTANPQSPTGMERSCPFELFQTLLRSHPTLQAYSLQKDITDREQQWLHEHHIPELGTGFTDLADTAGAIAQLDLVITVDTAVAHLAGALNKPVWVLLPFAADWRWLQQRQDSRWYPSMRLLRQSQINDWRSVIDEAIALLHQQLPT